MSAVKAVLQADSMDKAWETMAIYSKPRLTAGVLLQKEEKEGKLQ